LESFLDEIKTKPTSLLKEENKQIMEIVNRINRIQPIFFPDECQQPKPNCKIIRKTKKHKKIIQLCLSYMPADKIVVLPELKGMGFRVSYEGDGATKSFKIPYS
jgi:hypothetical protein